MRVLFLPGPTPTTDDVRAALLASHPDATVEVCAPEAAPAWLDSHPECDAVVVDGLALPPDVQWIASLRARRADLPIAVLVTPGDAPAEARALLAGADASMPQTPASLAQLGSLLLRTRRRDTDPERRDWRLWFAGRDTDLRRAVAARLGRRVLLMSLSRDGKLVPMIEDPANATALIVDARDSGDDMLAGLQRVRETLPTLATIVVADESYHGAFLRMGADDCVPPGADVERLLLAVERVSSQRQLAAEIVALRARENRLRAVVEYLPEAVVLVAASKAVQAVNLAGLELLGAAEARQVIGRELTPWLTGDADDDLVAFIDAVSAGSTRLALAATRHEQPRRVELRGVPFQREPGKPAAALITIRPLRETSPVEGVRGIAADELDTLRTTANEVGALRTRLDAEIAARVEDERRQRELVATLEHELEIERQRVAALTEARARETADAELTGPSIAALEQAVADERAHVARLAASLGDVRAHADTLQARLSEVAAQDDVRQVETEGLRQALAEVTSDLDRERAERHERADQVSALERALHEVRETGAQELAALQTELTAARDERERLAREQEELQHEKTRLADALAARSADETDAHDALVESQRRSEALVRELDEARLRVAALEAVIVAQDELRLALDEARTRHEAERATLTSAIEAREQRAASIEAERAADAERLQTLERDLTEAHAQKQEVERALAAEATRREAVDAQLAALHAQLTAEAERRAALEAAQAADATQLQTLERERVAAGERQMSVESELAQVREALADALSRLDAYAVTDEDVRAREIQLAAQLRDVEVDRDAARAMETRAAADVAMLSTALEDARATLADARATLAQVRGDRDALAAAMAARDEDDTGRREAAQAQAQQFDALTETAAQTQQALDAARAEAERLRAEATAAQVEREALLARLATLEAQRAEAEAAAAAERERHAEEVAAHAAARDEWRSALGRADADRFALEQAVAVAQAATALEQEAHATAERRRLELEAAIERERAAAAAAESALQAAMDEARSTGVEAHQEVAALSARIGELQEDLATRSREIALARDENDRLRETLTRLDEEHRARLSQHETERESLREEAGRWRAVRGELAGLRDAQRRVETLEGQVAESQRVRAQALALESEVAELREARELARRLESELAEARAALDARPAPPARLEAAVDEETRWLLYDVASIGHLTTTAEARILGANDIAARLLGHFSRDALQASGELPTPLLHAAEGFAHRPTRFEVCLQHGEEGPLHWIVGLATPHAGVPATVTWMLIDVSEQRLHARRSRFLRRMEAMTHVLSAATAESSVLVERVVPVLEAAEALPARDGLDIAGTRAALARTQAVLTQLSGFAAKRARRAGVHDMRGLLDGAGPVLVHVAGEDVACTLVLPDEPLHATVDAAEFQQFLTTVVMAGRDALPLGGRLILDLRATTSDARDEGTWFARPSIEIALRAEGYGVQPPEGLSGLQEAAGRQGAVLVTEFDGHGAVRLVVRLPRVFVTA